MAELGLNLRERDTFVRDLDRMRVADLVRCKAATYPSHSGGPMSI